jgi:hypothetical protein
MALLFRSETVTSTTMVRGSFGRDSGDDSVYDSPVPFNVKRAEPIRSELGDRLTEDSRVQLVAETSDGTRLVAYAIGDRASIIKVVTPVGLEQYYGLTRIDVDQLADRLAVDPRWTVTESRI